VKTNNSWILKVVENGPSFGQDEIPTVVQHSKNLFILFILLQKRLRDLKRTHTIKRKIEQLIFILIVYKYIGQGENPSKKDLFHSFGSSLLLCGI
jgi:hypothetical protein